MATTQKKPGRPPKNTKSTGTKPAQSRNKKPTEQELAHSHAVHQIWSIVLFAVAILLFSMAVVKGESVWAQGHNALLGLFGFGAYLLPLILIYVAIVSAMEQKKNSIVAKAVEAVVMVVFICAAIQVFSADGAPASYFSSIKDAYVDASFHINGGAMGAILGGALLSIFGKTGAAITIVLLLFVLFMFVTGLTLIQLFMSVWKPVKKIEAHTEARMEERYAQRQIKRMENVDVPLGPSAKDGVAIDIPIDPPAKKRGRKAGAVQDDSGKMGFADPPHRPEDDGPLFSDVLPEAPPSFLTEPEEEAPPAPEKPEEEKPAFLLDDIIKKAAAPLEQEQPAKKEEPAKEKKEEIPPFEVEDAEPAPLQDYQFPSPDLLEVRKSASGGDVSTELKANADKLVDTLRSFGVQTKITDICRGPTVTRYELKPSAGVKISKITGLADDIALNLAATGVRIEAPIPNKAAVGIEVPNRIKSSVGMRELIEMPEFKNAKSKLTGVLGKDITGNGIFTDIAKMPHLLIAGATGSGKSVCLNSIIVSILYRARPEEVKFLMIDPKTVELAVYGGIPHLLVPVVTDPRKAAGALGWAVSEMLSRYKTFADNGVRDITGYNKFCEKEQRPPMPQIVLVIDELADLMMAAPNEVEDSICRLAQMARAAGMHLVIATQRPSVDVITGIIKANIPSRIALTVSSQVDSRTILDMGGAEKLLGYGDMLYSPVGSAKPTRVQGCYLSDEEREKVIDFVKHQGETKYDDEVIKEIELKAAQEKKKGGMSPDGEEDDTDELLSKAIEIVVECGSASTVLLQRRLKVGYARGARIVDQLEERGIIGPSEGSKPRKVLITKQQWQEMNAMSDDFAVVPAENEVSYDEE